MEGLEKDILRADASTVVLSDWERAAKWIFRFISLWVAIAAFTILDGAYRFNDYFSEAIDGICFAVCVWIPAAVALWQVCDRTTEIQFNQPAGHLTIIKSPWWSIFIPAGPRFIKVPTQIPLPKSDPFVEEQSGIMSYPVRTGPESLEIRHAFVRSYRVQLPLDDGKNYTIWTTNDHNTYIEIISRIKKAMQDHK